jgi:putative nucleotidyltransferase with HDIG domain
MNSKTKAYCLFVTGAALALLPWLHWTTLWTMPSEELFGLGSLVFLALVSERLSVIATVGRHQTPSSIAFIPFLAAVLLFPITAAVAVVLITNIASQLVIHKRPKIRAVFNVAQGTVAILAANVVYEALGGRHSVEVKSLLLAPTGALAFAGLGFIFFFVNQILVSIAIAFVAEERITLVISRMFSGAGGNIFHDVLASPIAAVVALLYSNFQAAGLLLGILPLLVIRHSYATNVKLQQANKDLLTVLVKAIETRDPYTSGHSIRVAILAKAIAEDMDLSAPKVERIEMAAMVHDIGKVDAVYASIIRKEGTLSDAERRVIVTHAEKGAEFLETLTSFSEEVTSGVRHHHERYDGTGYPDGLKGDAIPLAARIIQLCDSIDAMLSDRPYRKALTLDLARSELVRCAGTQFDPRIVDVILRKNTLERAAALVRPETAKPHLVVASA